MALTKPISGPGDVLRREAFSTSADDVDDDAVPIGNSLVKLLGEREIPEDLQVPGRPPPLHVQLLQGPGRNRACIVDQNVQVTALCSQGILAFLAAEIARNAGYRDPGRAQFVYSAIERINVSGGDDDFAPFPAKRKSGGKPDSLGGARNKRPLAR